MRTLDPIVEALVSARVVSDIPLLTMTIVEDHSVPTLADPVVFSDHPVQRIFSPSGIEIPFLQSITFPIETIPHLPSETAGSVSAVSRQIAFTLANIEYEGVTLFEFLTQTGRMDRARLLLHTLTVPSREMGTQDRHLSFIHGDFTEGATTQFFEGRVERVVSVGDEIQCIGRTEIPQVDWKLVPDSGSDPRDRGQRMPIPMGENAIVRCVNLVVGAVTSLAQRLSIGSTDVVLADGSDFSAGGGTAMVAAEAITWTGRNGNFLTGVLRARLGTVEADHVVGAVVVDTGSPITLGVADRTISAVKGLFIRSETTGAAIEISPLNYSVDYDDEATAPGSSGDPITTITMTGAQISGLINSLLADAAITQQPQYSVETPPTTGITTDPVIFATNSLFDQGSGARGSWVDHQTNPVWTFANSGDQEGLRTNFSDGLEESLVKGLLSVSFFFQVQVTNFGKDITVGLTATGLEGVVQGFVDGSLVASLEIVSGGLKQLRGPSFLAVAGKDIGDLTGVVLDFVKSEVATGGSLTIAVNSITMRYAFVNDVVEETATFTPNVGISVNGTGSPQFDWQGNWSGLTGVSPQQVVVLGTPRTAELSYTTDPSPNGLAATKLKTATLKVRAGTSGVNIGANNTFTMDTFNTPFLTSVPSDVSLALFENTNVTSSENLTLIDRATSADLIGTTFDMAMSGDSHNDTDARIELGLAPDFEFGFLFTYDVKDATLSPIEQTLDAQIQASAGGISLEFFAVCDGPIAPDATYIAAADDLLTNPADLLHWWLRVVGEFDAADIDSAGTFASAGANLTSFKFGFDARNVGGNWADILARISHESKANTTRPSGGPWKMLAPASDGTFATPTITIDSLSDLIAIGKDDDELKTRMTVYFGFDPRSNQSTSDDFTQVRITDPTQQDVKDREAEFGRNDEDPRFLFCHRFDGDGGVFLWQNYMEQELGRPARVISARVDTWQGFALEIGDVVTLDHPTLGGLVKARVIETQRSQQRGLLLRFVEVL